MARASSKVLIVASGGGHTGFARAIGQSLPFKADYVIPKDDKYSIEMIKDLSNNIYEIEKWREPNKAQINLANFLNSFFKSISLPKYPITVATGSNHSLFPAFFERVKGSRLVSIESQDRFFTRGKAIGLLSKISEAVLLHWEEQKGLYKNGIVVGPIVEKPKYEPKDGGYILVTTGTYGFKRLFMKLKELDLKYVVIQTGKENPENYKKPSWIAFQFDRDIERWIANSSLIITHQGKTAMEAVVMYRKPTIIVYNRDWSKATTYEDAKKYAEVLGVLFLDDPITWSSSEVLFEAINRVKEPKKIRPGTEKAVNVIMKLLEGL
jgi:UDP-N-acetylglucosamine:LPS N-acetylglucosamine transferase